MGPRGKQGSCRGGGFSLLCLARCKDEGAAATTAHPPWHYIAMQSSAAEEGQHDRGGAGVIGRLEGMERGVLDSEGKPHFPINAPVESTACSATGLRGGSRGG